VYGRQTDVVESRQVLEKMMELEDHPDLARGGTPGGG